MDEQVINLLRKYLDNQCIPEELDQVQAILRSDRYEDEWAVLLRADAEKNIEKGDMSGVLNAAKADRLLGRIVESAGIDDAGEDKQLSRMLRYAAAASVLLLITAGLTFFPIPPVWETASVTETVTTEKGQAEVLLPDGTRVWLNDLSNLSYPEEFEDDIRKVQLEGRAFFDVASDPSRPFRVQTNGLTISVLGTSFDVSAYESDRDMTVTVASGSVRVEGPFVIPKVPGSIEEDKSLKGQSVNTLQPGEQLTYDRKNQQYVRQTMTLSDIRALRAGRLVFQNRALVDIARTLERRYGITFRFGDASVKEQRLTFKPNSSDLDDVLQVLSLVSGFEYERHGGEVFMSEK